MTDRDRLIELILNRERVDLPLPIEYQEDLADYLLANGVIVPPCKVGDMVYRIAEDSKTIKEERLAEMQIKNIDRYEVVDEEVPDICEIQLRNSGIDIKKILEG